MSHRWKRHEVNYLLIAWSGRDSAPSIGAILGRTPVAVMVMAQKHRLKSPFKSRLDRYQPPKSEWVRIATEKANDASVCPVKVLAGVRASAYRVPRWRAWKAILESSPTYSIAGVARTSGFHHTSILSSLKRLEAMGINN